MQLKYVYLYIYTYIHSSIRLGRTPLGNENYYVLPEFTLHRDAYKFTNLVKKYYIPIRSTS